MLGENKLLSLANNVSLSFEEIMKKILHVRKSSNDGIKEMFGCSVRKSRDIYRDLLEALIPKIPLRNKDDMRFNLDTPPVRGILNKYDFFKSGGKLDPAAVKKWIQSVREKGIHNIVAQKLKFINLSGVALPSLDFDDEDPAAIIIKRDITLPYSIHDHIEHKMRRID